MGVNLYRELTKLLSDAGCTFVRQAKGSHEIWFSPITNRKITVPRNIVIVHTANGILRDAGLLKVFCGSGYKDASARCFPGGKVGGGAARGNLLGSCEMISRP